MAGEIAPRPASTPAHSADGVGLTPLLPAGEHFGATLDKLPTSARAALTAAGISAKRPFAEWVDDTKVTRDAAGQLRQRQPFLLADHRRILLGDLVRPVAPVVAGSSQMRPDGAWRPDVQVFTLTDCVDHELRAASRPLRAGTPLTPATPGDSNVLLNLLPAEAVTCLQDHLGPAAETTGWLLRARDGLQVTETAVIFARTATRAAVVHATRTARGSRITEDSALAATSWQLRIRLADVTSITTLDPAPAAVVTTGSRLRRALGRGRGN
jgi:hypothetical protein